MPRMSLPDSLQLCRISRCLYTPYVQDQQIFGFIIDRLPTLQLQLRPIDDFFIRRTFQDLAGYPRILDIVDLRPLRGRHVYKASTRSALLDSLQPCKEIYRCLYTSFDQDHALGFLLSLEHQTSRAVCFNARGLLYECVFDALLFSSSYRPVEKPVSHHVATRPTFFSFSFLDRHTSHPARYDAQILPMSASSMPSGFFHRRFDLLEACLL
jgi:hypothetical protein